MDEIIYGIVLVIAGICLGGILVMGISNDSKTKSEKALCSALDGVLVVAAGGETVCVSKTVIIGR